MLKLENNFHLNVILKYFIGTYETLKMSVRSKTITDPICDVSYCERGSRFSKLRLKLSVFLSEFDLRFEFYFPKTGKVQKRQTLK